MRILVARSVRKNKANFGEPGGPSRRRVVQTNPIGVAAGTKKANWRRSLKLEVASGKGTEGKAKPAGASHFKLPTCQTKPIGERGRSPYRDHRAKQSQFPLGRYER